MKKDFAALLLALLLMFAASAMADELTVQLVLTVGQDTPVYSVPDALSASGTDSVDTLPAGTACEVYAQFGDRLLIQYTVDEMNARFGYVDPDILPAGASVEGLTGIARNACLTEAAALTDDPLRSQRELLELPKGQSLVSLATMGDWVYVEIISGNWAFGFVPQNLLIHDAFYDLADHSEGLATGMLFVTPDNVLRLAMWPATDWASPAILLRDELQGIDIGLAKPDENGRYLLLDAAIPEGATSISFIPVDRDGAQGDALFRVEW